MLITFQINREASLGLAHRNFTKGHPLKTTPDFLLEASRLDLFNFVPFVNFVVSTAISPISSPQIPCLPDS
jgi:hypothetical protein